MFKKYWNLLTRQEKKKSSVFLILTLFNTILEVSAVLMVLPLTQILLREKINIPYLNFEKFSYINNLAYSKLVLLSIFSLLIIFLLKILFYIYYTFWQFKYTGDIEKRLSTKLLEKYIYRPYIHYLSSNTGIMNNNILNEVQHIPGNIRMFLTLFSEFIILILIGGMLILFEPQGSLSVISVSIIMLFLLNGIQKKYMSYFGHQRYLFSGESNKNLIQGLQNIKDIKLLNKEEHFINQYYKNFNPAIKFKVYYDSLSATPRPISEIILIVSFVVLISILVGKNDSSLIIQTTTLFLIATYRLLPSVVRITGAYQSIQLRKKVANTLINDLVKFDEDINKINFYKKNNSKFFFRNEIKLENIKFSYPGSKKVNLDNINLTIKKGETVGIVGQSGSGKTTLIDIILCLLRPQNGKIIVDGNEITDDNLRDWQSIIGYVPQSPNFIDDSIKKNIAFGIDEKDMREDLLNSSIKESNIDEFLSYQQIGINTIIGDKGVRVSGGQKQRIAIARALYKRPEIIIFDEATSSLDEKNETEIINNISLVKNDKTVIVIAHKLSILKNCDKIIKIDNGSIKN